MQCIQWVHRRLYVHNDNEALRPSLHSIFDLGQDLDLLLGSPVVEFKKKKKKIDNEKCDVTQWMNYNYRVYDNEMGT